MPADSLPSTQLIDPGPSTVQSIMDSIVGAAIFDLSGLPKDYFTTAANQDVSWVQTIFQALGLQTLLMSSLRLEGFRYSVIHGADYQAIIVRQKQCYTAVLIAHSGQMLPQTELIQHIHDIEPGWLKSHPRFNSV